jgi:FKBP-type peptidyl-prolyl cis-trans isomerase SlyD
MTHDSDARGGAGNGVTVGTGTVLTLHYTVRDEASGEALETSAGREPLTILYGQRGMLVAVQEALAGKSAGEEVTVTVPPERAFGLRREDAMRRVSKKYFANPRQLRPGLRTALRTESGSQPVTVVKVGGKMVDVDTNHPYAGLTLTFVVEILDVRPASPEEIDHGHVHGPGGHVH